MTSTLAPPPPAPVAPTASGSNRAARRAISRWSWRLLRREWRQQVLILALLAVAVGATTVGLGLIVSVNESIAAQTGDASTRVDISGVGGSVNADIAAARQQFGSVEAIEHENVKVPGSITPIDLRAQAQHGKYSSPMVRLVSGRYPSTGDQVAITSSVGSLLGLKIGSTWVANGHSLHVVGIIENPNDLSDSFAVVPPGSIASPSSLTLLTGSTGSATMSFRPPGGQTVGITSTGENAAQRQRLRELGVLLIATIGLTFISLLAVAGFTVMAQRRMRALGMIGAIGATDRQVRRALLANGVAVGTVGAGIGVVAGLVVWFAFRSAFENLVGHRIDPFNIPWWAVIAGGGLAVLAALAASWWPARATSRIPIVAALSGRPPAPKPAHRFAVLGVALSTLGFVLLVLAKGQKTTPIVAGILTSTAGMLLLAPLGVRALGAIARRAPVAMRLALRDLARYQARSGAAVAAAGLAVGVAATIAITAAAEQSNDHTLTGGNLPTNQLVVWLDGPPDGPPGNAIAMPAPGQRQSSVYSAAAVTAGRNTADSIARSLGAQHEVELDVAENVGLKLQPGDPPSANWLALVHQITINGQHGFNLVATPYIATPQILSLYGISSRDIAAETLILTSRPDLSDTQLFTGDRTAGSNAHVQVSKRLPNYRSAPNTLITEQAARAQGLTAQPIGWLIQTAAPLTTAQIRSASQRAAAAGITIETRTAESHSLQQLRNWATLIGVLVALGVLAMTVGLIRSETSGDLRTLAATGARASTRRTLIATTAAALGALGGVLGVAGAYLALIAWHWHHVSYLSAPPYAQLAALVLGIPAVAFIAGWLLSRSPSGIARRALE